MDARTVATRELWRLDDLLIDVGRQRVLRAGADLELPRLSFDLLLALVRRAPDVVSVDELMSLVWPGLVVGPETVSQRVKLLRQALDDRAEQPRYVASLRGRGYHLSGTPVRVAEEQAGMASSAAAATAAATTSAAEAVPATALSPPGPPSPDRAWRAPALSALLVVLLLLVVALGPSRAPHGPDASDEAVEIANFADRTVAVLPFASLSPDPADAYLAESFAEILQDRLATVPGLTVLARDSSFAAASHSRDAREVGRALGARYVVGGSVMRSGDRFRVAVRLVDTQSGTQVWSQAYAGEIAHVFEMHDGIAQGAGAELRARITGLGPIGGDAIRSSSLEANLAYLRGKVLLGRYTVAAAEAAAGEFEQAVSLDPEYAGAHAALYDARMQAAGLRHDDLEAAQASVRPHLERALELDPEDGQAWFAKAMWDDLGFDERLAAYRRAVRLDPRNVRGLIAYSEFLDLAAARPVGSGFDPSSRSALPLGGTPGPGFRQEADQMLARASEIDPLSSRVRFRRAMRTVPFTLSGAEGGVMAILQTDPDYYPALQRLAKYRSIFHGRTSEAIEIIERAIGIDPGNPWAPHTAVAFYLDVGDDGAAGAVARSTPASARTAETVLHQFRGDWRAAGTAALRPDAFEFGFNESWGVPEALRDFGLNAGDLVTPARVISERFGLRPDAPGSVRFANYRAAVPLAHLRLAAGDQAGGRALLESVIRYVDSEVDTPPVYKRRTQAQALMLLGERDRALELLSASFFVDGDYTQWWYTLEHDPVWAAVRADPRFLAIETGVHAHVERERATVDALRQSGRIPARAPPSGAGASG